MKHHRPSACPERPDDAVSVFAMGLDPVDLALLALHRHYFRTFADPASQAWMMALAEDDGHPAIWSNGARFPLVAA